MLELYNQFENQVDNQPEEGGGKKSNPKTDLGNHLKKLDINYES